MGSTQAMFDLGSDMPSIPTTPRSVPLIRLPGSHTSDLMDASTRAKPTSLHDFTIPSPLLYHSKSREDLLGIYDDKHNSSMEKALLVCGQDPPDPECETFQLGSPLQPPRDERRTHRSNTAKLTGYSGEGFSSANDPAFYRRTRTYLTYPLGSEEGCSPAAAPATEFPLLTTTKAPRSRQTHVYPGEFALTEPITWPSSTWIPDPSVPGLANQTPLATASVVNMKDSLGCKSQTFTNAGLATPPPEPDEAQLTDSPFREVNKESSKVLELAKKTMFTPGHAQDNSPKCNNTDLALAKPVRSGSDEMTTDSPEAEPQSQSQAVKDGGAGIPVLDGKPYSHANSDSESVPIALSKPSNLERGDDASPFSNFTTIRTDASGAIATGSALPARISPPHPVCEASTSCSSSSPSTPSTLGPTKCLDNVEIQPCPTTACTALLLVMPTPKGLASGGQPCQEERLGGKLKAFTVAVTNIAADLGFQLEHGKGCRLGGRSLVNDVDGKETDVQTGVEAELQLQSCTDGGASGRGRGMAGQREGGSVADGERQVEGDISGGDEDGDGFKGGWKDGWVGEGEGIEFWI